MEGDVKPKKEWVLKKLRESCDSNGKEKDPERSAEYLMELADLCRENDFFYFIDKCTLLNGVFSRCGNEDRKEEVENKLRSLGSDLLKRCGAANKDTDLLGVAKGIKDGLETRRSFVRNELQNLKHIPDSATGKELHDMENERIDWVKSFMKKVSAYYIETMGQVSKAVIQALGHPPCPFSHFAMGSLARDEVTLYSDFENAIILDDDKVPGIFGDEQKKREKILEYFRHYAVIFHVIVINFCETPIPTIGIKGLNDYYSGRKCDNWFYDIYTHFGIRFDGFMPFASKTPFGRKPTFRKPVAIELILPMREMLEFLEEEKSLSEGYNLSDMLVESRHVAGDEKLFEQFKKSCVEKTGILRRSKDYIKRKAKTAQKDTEKFDLTPESSGIGWEQNLKKSFYRPMSVYIPFLTLLFDVAGCCNSFEVIEKFKVIRDEVPLELSPEVKHNLSYALAIANQLRLQVYSERLQQKEEMAGAVRFVSKSSGVSNVFDAVGHRSALDYYEISLGLRSAMTEILRELDRSLHECLDIRLISESLENNLKKRGNFKLYGDIYKRFQNYEKAIACFEKALKKCEDDNNGKPNETKVEILMSLGFANLYALRFHYSLEHYGNAVDVEKMLDRGETSLFNIATSYTMMGQSYTEIPRLDEHFEPCMQKAVCYWEKLISAHPDNRKYIRGLAEVRDTKAFHFFRRRKFDKSLETYRQAGKLFEDYYGPGISNDDTVKVQNGIALCLLNLKRYEEALGSFDEILSLKQSMLGTEVADVNVSWYLRSKGDALKNLERYEEAIESYEKSIATREACHGSNYDKCSALANTMYRMADCYYKSMRYEEALNAANKTWHLANKIPESVRGKEFMGLAKELKEKIQGENKENDKFKAGTLHV